MLPIHGKMGPNDVKRKQHRRHARRNTSETQATGGAAWDKDKQHDDEDDAATKTTKATIK